MTTQGDGRVCHLCNWALKPMQPPNSLRAGTPHTVDATDGSTSLTE